MALDVIVNISEMSTTGAVGFGIPLVIVSKSAKAVPYTECTELSEVEKLFGAETEIYNIAKLIWGQKNKSKSIAFYASTNDAETAVNEVIHNDWRQLIVVFGEDDTKTAADVSEYIETTNDKMYFVTVSEMNELTTLSDKERTVAFYYDLKDSNGKLVAPNAVAAIVGESAGRDAGSFTYKNLIISGLAPLEITENQLNGIHEAGAITLLRKAGDVVTSEGKNTQGDYIDIVDSKDWIIKQIGYQSQKLLNASEKLPYTNQGIAALENVTKNVLQEAYNNGMIATGDDDATALYNVNFKSRSEMSEADRKNRIYSGGNFDFTLAGAIHTAHINGELVI